MMSMLKIYFPAVLFVVQLFTPSTLSAQDSNVAYKILDQSRFTVQGKSTVGSYQIEAGEFMGQILLRDQNVSEKNMQLFEQFELGTVTVNSASLDAGGPIFNKHVRQTIQSDQYPKIEYWLEDLVVSAESLKPWKIIQTTGVLEVAGVQHDIVFECRGYWPADSGPEFEGSVEIDMTEFGLEPPVLFFGALRTNKRVNVQFHLYLSQKI